MSPVESSLIHPSSTEKIREVDSIESQHPSLDELLREDVSARRALGAWEILAKPIAADCDTRYAAVRSSGTRPLTEINLHIIHCTQGPTALACASWFTNQKCQGSATYAIDDEHCFRTLKDRDIPWGAPGANYHGLHYEQAGYVTWKEVVWSKTHRRMLRRTAYKVARDCKRYGNPVKWLTVEALKKDGAKGITDHLTCTKAFGGSHTDPGPNYPRRLFMTFVRYYYSILKIRKVA